MPDDDKQLPEGVVDIGGRGYVTVAKRISDFRKEHPVDGGWGIVTTIEFWDGDSCRMTAVIEDANGKTVALGIAMEERELMDPRMQRSILEVCQTSAVGRALAMAGFGGNYEVASAEEMRHKVERQKKLVGPKRMREIVDGMLDAISNQHELALLEIVDELDNDEHLEVWGQLRSWERSAVKKLLKEGRDKREEGERNAD